jgi:hypothetical protein
LSLILTGRTFSSVSGEECEGHFAKVELVRQEVDAPNGLVRKNWRGPQVKGYLEFHS